jgi:hypothetical protein
VSSNKTLNLLVRDRYLATNRFKVKRFYLLPMPQSSTPHYILTLSTHHSPSLTLHSTNRFKVKQNKEATLLFEKRWADRESKHSAPPLSLSILLLSLASLFAPSSPLPIDIMGRVENETLG